MLVRQAEPVDAAFDRHRFGGNLKDPVAVGPFQLEQLGRGDLDVCALGRDRRQQL